MQENIESVGNMLDKCDICGRTQEEDELVCGVCEDCIEEYRYDFDVCYEIGKKDSKGIVQINAFLFETFDEDEIEEILMDRLREYREDKSVDKSAYDCSNFIDTDRSWFVEKLKQYLDIGD